MVLRSAFALPAAARQQVCNVLQEHLGRDVSVRFETAPEVLCGIELQGQGQKIAWSLEHYLEALEEQLSAVFEAGAEAQRHEARRV